MDSKTARVVADRIKILGDHVMIYSKSDMTKLCIALMNRNIEWTIRTDFNNLNDNLKIYPATLWWDHSDASDQYNLPQYNTNIITNKSFNTNYPFDLVTSTSEIESLDFDDNTLKIGVDEMSDIWPDIHKNYHDHIGFIAGTPAPPNSFIHVNTYNIRQQVKKLVDQGIKRIIVTQLHEGALIDFYIKTQLVAWACRDFFRPEHFIITTTTVGAQDAWQNYCNDNNITDSISIMECNITESFCWPNPDDKQILDNTPYDVNKTHDKIFTSLNAGVLRRHRYELGVELMEQGIFDKGIVSFSDYTSWLPDSDAHGITYGSQHSQEKFINVMPVWVDIRNIFGAANIDQDVTTQQLHLYDSYFSIVTETQFYSVLPKYFNEHFMIKDTVFRTEKTLKPMWFKHPFITVGPRGYMKTLRDQGYKTFHPYINEDYDSEPNDNKRLRMIVSEAKRLCDFNQDQWRAWKDNIAPIVEHNYKWIQNNDIPKSYKNYEYLFEEIV